MIPEQIERETSIAAPVERVWAVLTQAEHVGRWFGDAGAELDLRPGGEMVVRWSGVRRGHARVVDVEPHASLLVPLGARTASPGAKSPPRALDAGGVHARADGDGTRLRVVESGFEALDATDGRGAAELRRQPRGLGEQLDTSRVRRARHRLTMARPPTSCSPR